MLNLLLTLEYDGFDYKGWIKQKNALTIQGELEKAFFNVCQIKLWTLGASKTDAGVHACDQKVLVKIPFQPKDLVFFIKTVSYSLPLNINIKNYVVVDENFNVRDTKEKEYIYTINDQDYDLVNHRYELRTKQQYDEERLHTIAQIFVGEHDFAFFSGVKIGETIKTVRTINTIDVARDKTKKIKIHFKGKGFIRYQIRMIVQNILECYHGRVTIETLQEQLANPPAGKTTIFSAKPYGLCLAKIIY
ncbi:tRNA pseudouridine synthase A [Spiroplasma chrysopicola]|uniref:tRNA pseudouridine synthase A n=1 Tax=Spiroplasma chrysopicola DF-1 TaxID=1276227 RepID=R4UHG5_9MOLU|nr:tRNA pseudouridine synthase A [Spiroplasma chrysopicola]AGM24771.1 tRNA pseudouridine synthase A [Spiroplasma chrysopicola DF-1]